MAVRTDLEHRDTSKATSGYTARLHTHMATVRSAWRRCEIDGVCTAYQLHQWVDAIVEKLLLPQKGKPLVVELSCGVSGDLLMIVPLMLRSRLGYREITWLNCGVCDYAAPLLAQPLVLSPEEAEKAWAAILSVLPASDRLHITGIPETIGAHDNPLALLKSARESITTTAGFAISGPPETLIKRVCRPSFTKDFNKRCRRLERIGAVHFEEATNDAQLDLIFGVLVEQRLSRFRQLGRFDLLAQPVYVDFYLEAARQGLADGSVRVFGLRVDNDWIATCYIMIHGGRAHGLLLAMDQDRWFSASPGLMIVARTMEWSRAQGLDYFDMSVGSRHYKESMGADSAVLLEIDESLTFKGRLVGTIHEHAQTLKAWIQSKPVLYERLRRGRAWLRRGSTSVRESGSNDG